MRRIIAVIMALSLGACASLDNQRATCMLDLIPGDVPVNDLDHPRHPGEKAIAQCAERRLAAAQREERAVGAALVLGIAAAALGASLAASSRTSYRPAYRPVYRPAYRPSYRRW